MAHPEKKTPPAIQGGYGIDTHCHLDMEVYQSDLPQVLERARQSSIHKIITIGIDLTSSRKAVQIAAENESIFASVGIHPHNTKDADDETYAQIKKLAAHPKTVAYGEIGLDYAKLYTPADRQRQQFRYQLQLAAELKLPIIIHDRDAHDDTMSIVKEFLPLLNGGIMHCFSGNIDFAATVLESGFLISIPGIVTFKNAHDLQQVAQEIPLASMLLETDGPFLCPSPFRGKRNEPSYILFIAQKIAELRNMPIEEVLIATTENAEKIFRINKH